MRANYTFPVPFILPVKLRDFVKQVITADQSHKTISFRGVKGVHAPGTFLLPSFFDW